MGTGQLAPTTMVFCRGCGKEIHNSAPTCPNCGAVQVVVQQQVVQQAGVSDKRILPAFLLCFLFGVFGAHRFYVGKVGSGIAQLFTFGGLGIWALVDLILIVLGSFEDKAGNRLTIWT